MKILFILSAVLNSSNANSQLILTLEEAIKIALEKNKTILQEAKKELELSYLNIKKTEKEFKPKIVHTSGVRERKKKGEREAEEHFLSYNFEQPFLTPTGGKLSWKLSYNLQKTMREKEKFSSDYNISATLKQPLSKGGREFERLSFIKAKEDNEKMHLSYILNKEKVVMGVIENYYTLLRIRKEIAYQEEVLNLFEKMLKWMNAMFYAGKISELDVMNMKVQLSSAKENLLSLKIQEKSSLTSFIRLLGYHEDEEKEIILNEEICIEPIKISVDESIKIALEKRADIRRFELELKQAKREIEITSSKTKPLIYIRANYKREGKSEKLQKAFKHTDYEGEIGINLFYPFFDSGLTDTEVKIAKINYEKLLENFRLLKEDIMERIRNLFEELNKNHSRIELLSLTLSHAQKAFEISKLKYEIGIGTLREMLEAQLNFFKVKNALLDAKIAYVLNKARLIKERGELLEKYAS